MRDDDGGSEPSLFLAAEQGKTHREHLHHQHNQHNHARLHHRDDAPATAIAAASVVTEVIQTISLVQQIDVDSNGVTFSVLTVLADATSAIQAVLTDLSLGATTGTASPSSSYSYLASATAVDSASTSSGSSATIASPSTLSPSQSSSSSATSLTSSNSTTLISSASSLSLSSTSTNSTSTVPSSSLSSLTTSSSRQSSSESSLTLEPSSGTSSTSSILASSTSFDVASSITSLSTNSFASRPLQPTSTNSDRYIAGGTAGGTGTTPGSATSTAASSSNGSGSAPAVSTSAVVGGVVGSVAGVAFIALLLLFLVKWKKNRSGGGALLSLGSGRDGAGEVGDAMLGGPSSQPAGGMVERQSFVHAVPAAFASLTGYKRSSQRTESTATSERGFVRVSGRKLPSVLQTGGDGYGGGLPDETLSGSSFYRDSHGFYGGPGTPTFPPREMQRGSGQVGTPVMRPSPARTPVQEQGPFAAPPQLEVPMPPRRPDGLGRSHPSQDGSHTSRFTEEV